MKTTIYLILAIAWLIYLSQPTISFKPFSIEFAKPYIPFGWLCVIIAMICFEAQGFKDGYKKSTENTISILHKVAKEK